MISTKLTYGIIGGIGASILSYIGIQEEIFTLFMLLILIDVITGFIKGFLYKNLKSKTAYLGIFKKIGMIFIILSSGILLQILKVASPGTYIYILFGILSLIEFYSIVGNIYIISTGKEYASEFDAFSFFLKIILRTTEKELKNRLKEEENK